MSNVAEIKNGEPEIAIPQSLVFSDEAARKVRELIEEEGNYSLMLRVYITGGGCSGFQYGFSFEEKSNADDFIIEKEVANDEGSEGGCSAVKLLVDPMSYQYLMGAEIDYKEDINGSQFVIRNPNAQTTCGCGSSFNI